MALMVGDAVAISLIGGVLGLLLADVLCGVLRQSPITFADMSRVRLPGSMWGVCLGVAVMIGVIASVAPAWNAARRSIVEALRFND